MLRAAADRLVGPGERASAGYQALYRSFDHGEMKRVCTDLSATTLKDRYRRLFGLDRLSQAARNFANAFSVLQRARHLADYDPSTPFPPTGVRGLIDMAEVAILAFDAVEAVEKADILILLMVGARD